VNRLTRQLLGYGKTLKLPSFQLTLLQHDVAKNLEKGLQWRKIEQRSCISWYPPFPMQYHTH
jgi:hypothetical protein